MDGIIEKQLNNLNYEELASDLDIPVLILQGTDDEQVFAETDFQLLKTVYAGKEATFKLYDGLDHLFMRDKEEKVDKEVINDIAKWIKNLN